MTPKQPNPTQGWALRHVRVSEVAFLIQVCQYLPPDHEEGSLAPWGIDPNEVRRLTDGTRLVGLDR